MNRVQRLLKFFVGFFIGTTIGFFIGEIIRLFVGSTISNVLAVAFVCAILMALTIKLRG